MVVFPTHRLVNNVKIDEVMAVSLLKDDFDIDKIIVDSKTSMLCDAIAKDLVALKRKRRALRSTLAGEYYYRLSLNDASVMEKVPA